MPARRLWVRIPAGVVVFYTKFDYNLGSSAVKLIAIKCVFGLGGFFGPYGLRAPSLVADGHCFHILFLFLRFLLFTHFGETPVTENLFPPIFWHN